MASCYQLQVVRQALYDIKRSLELLNDALSTRTFIVGTLADIAVTCNLLLAYKQVLQCDWFYMLCYFIGYKLFSDV